MINTPIALKDERTSHNHSENTDRLGLSVLQYEGLVLSEFGLRQIGRSSRHDDMSLINLLSYNYRSQRERRSHNSSRNLTNLTQEVMNATRIDRAVRMQNHYTRIVENTTRNEIRRGLQRKSSGFIALIMEEALALETNFSGTGQDNENPRDNV
jgi:hypothetical protein